MKMSTIIISMNMWNIIIYYNSAELSITQQLVNGYNPKEKIMPTYCTIITIYSGASKIDKPYNNTWPYIYHLPQQIPEDGLQ